MATQQENNVPQQEMTVTAAPPPAAPMQAKPQEDDIADWINRARDFLNHPETITTNMPPTSQPWHHRLFAFFDPIDTCAITCCCPCITFGKTHHRLHHDPALKDYSAVNASCLGFLVTSCFAGNIVMMLLQRHEIKARFGLLGDFPIDCLRAWCCGCCDLIQQDKEAQYRLLNQTVTTKQPASHEEMTVPT
jgi:Cys-rich protein (TIGR01571 family)